MNFMEATAEAFSANRLTANGDVAYTAQNKNLAFFANAGASRGDYLLQHELVLEAWNENPVLCAKNLFHLRDIRGGIGERDAFRFMVMDLIFQYGPKMTNTTDDLYKFLNLVREHASEYGRWDDLYEIVMFTRMLILTRKRLDIVYLSDWVRKTIKYIADIFASELYNTKHGKTDGLSLMSKWFPLQNNISKKKQYRTLQEVLYNAHIQLNPAEWVYPRTKFRYFAVGDFCNEIYLAMHDYSTHIAHINSRQARMGHIRKWVVFIRKHLNILEQKMSANKWDDIEFEKLPSYAHMKHQMAFKRHTLERYTEYQNRLSSGTAKVNTRTLFPYDLVRLARRNRDTDEIATALWKNMPDLDCNPNAICVVDTSSSMFVRPNITADDNGKPNVSPFDVAVSLGLYFAEHNPSEVFGGKIITFSNKPSLYTIPKDISLGRLSQDMAFNINWGMNTDLRRVFKLIVDAAEKNGLTNKDIPDTVYIISDMQFDEACDTSNSTFNDIDKMFKNAGLIRPKLVFWNVNTYDTAVPTIDTAHNVTLVSGCSAHMFNFAIGETTPSEFMMQVLNSTRYENITW